MTADKTIMYAFLSKQDKQGNCKVSFVSGGEKHKESIRLEDLGNGYVHVFSVHNEQGLKPFEILRATLSSKLNKDNFAIEVARSIAR